MKKVDLTNLRFGRLLVINKVGIDSRGQSRWQCMCDCGNGIVVVGSSLKNERTKSCGCLRRETVPRIKYDRSKYVGGISGTAWNSIQKCAAKRDIEFNITQDYI